MPAYDQLGGQSVDDSPAVSSGPAGSGSAGVGPAVDGSPVPGTDVAEGAVMRQLQQVDEALAGLAGLPVEAQVGVFTDLHQQLTAALAVTATATGPAEQRPAATPPAAQGTTAHHRAAAQPAASQPAAQHPGRQHRPGPPLHRSG